MTSTTQGEQKFWLHVVLDVPLTGPFDYWHTGPVPVGQRVLVPFGRRKLVGIVVACPARPTYDQAKVRAIERVLDDMPPMPQDWIDLGRFAAQYYHRPLGEVLLPALPAPLRTPGPIPVNVPQGGRWRG